MGLRAVTHFGCGLFEPTTYCCAHCGALPGLHLDLAPAVLCTVTFTLLLHCAQARPLYKHPY